MFGMNGWCKEPNNAGNGSDCPKNAQNSEDRTTGDLISRAAAIDDLHGKDPSQIWDTADIEVWVNALPSAQPTDADIQKMQDIEQAMLEKAYECGKQDAAQWIPCSERLPEDEQPILFSTTTGRVHQGRFHRDNSVNRWYSSLDKMRAYNNVVNAWMPLPEPYMEDDHETD